MNRMRLIFIIVFCIMMTVDIWVERSVYHYTLEFLNLYGSIAIAIINWILDYWVFGHDNQVLAV